jgi:hypothetical protein
MKTRISIYPLVIAAMAVTTFSSCDKDKDEVIPPFEALLIAHPWTYDNVEFGDMSDPDAEEDLEDAKDNLDGYVLTFLKDHTYTNNRTAEKGTWKMSEDGKKLTVDEGTDQTILDLVKLDENSLTTRQHDEDFGDITIYFVK